jgi:hypothetical protein
MSKTHSNLFRVVEGKRGEVLSSALLKYLFDRDITYLNAFIRLLPEQSIHTSNKSTTEVEVGTTWQPSDEEPIATGYLDLLIQTDRVTIGIENKIWAPFEERQPIKYCSSLLDRTPAGLNCFMVVLVPSAKEQEAKKQLHEVETVYGSKVKTVIVIWEHLLEVLTEVPGADFASRFVVKELGNFVHYQLFDDSFDVLGLLRDCEGEWTENHRKILDNILWHIFPGPGKLGKSDKWLGRNFRSTDDGKELGWYGFVRKSQLKVKNNEDYAAVELIIAAPRKELGASTRFDSTRRVGLISEVWGDWQSWIIDFGEDWNDFLKWQNCLEPLYKFLAKSSE